MASDNQYQYVKWAAYVVAAAGVVAAISFLPLEPLATAVKGWVESLGMWGPVALGLIYVVATVLFVPGTLLTLVAGAVFGLLVGFITVSISSTIGAGLAFLIARYVARGKVESMADDNEHFDAIDEAIEEGGWKVVGLLRLSPAIPFNLQNYLYGLTKVNFWTYLLTSWVAMMPGTFMYVYLGHVSGAALGGDREKSTAEWVMLGVGLVATIAVTVYITRLAKSKLNKVDQDVGDSDSAREDPSDDSDDQEPGSSAEDGSGPGSKQASFPLGAVTAAVISVGIAVAAWAFSGKLEKLAGGLAGPPAVEMKETYQTKPDGPTMDHSVFDSLLSQHVDEDGWVDYEALKDKQNELDDYLSTLQDAPFDQMGRNEKLALLINAYNAFTIKLINEKSPAESIKDIPAEQRWDAKRWSISGKKYSLGQIEHELIRPNFKDARIHFAVVCAAVGCPPLRNEAYTADRLDQQLEQQAQYVHDHKTWFQFNHDTAEGDEGASLKLTKLYQWYGGDFSQMAESEVRYAAQHSDPLQSWLEREESEPPKPEWLPYDWSLNSKDNKQER